MKRGAGSSKILSTIILLVAVVLWLRSQRTPDPEQSRDATGAFERYTACRLVNSRGNDGDSFQVRLPDGREEIFRLYYVDSPESAFKSYHNGETNHERIADQAEDMGRITPELAVEIGRRAKQFSHDQLVTGFTLHTRWDSPFQDERYHAFVELEGSPKWLHERLVSEGLVRIHTKPETLPDGTSVEEQLHRLRELEKTAKERRIGVWSLRVR